MQYIQEIPGRVSKLFELTRNWEAGHKNEFEKEQLLRKSLRKAAARNHCAKQRHAM